MKLQPTLNRQPSAANAQRVRGGPVSLPVGHRAWQVEGFRRRAAFTMIEIAICLAIIGFALVAIIGVLPLGMNTQRDNREETVINQDATVLLEAIRNGALGADELTNYVYAITNYWTLYNLNGTVRASGINGYTYNAGPAITTFPNLPYSSAPITNGANIVGLLSTPEFVANVFQPPATIYPVVPSFTYVAGRYGQNFSCFSNHVVAYVRCISGLAAEKPPQDNQIMRDDSLAYRLLCVNAPVPVDTNDFTIFAQKVSANQRELRLTFLWPQLPNGKVGNGRQTFRTTIAGQLTPTNYDNWPNQWLYFYQTQSFTNSP